MLAAEEAEQPARHGFKKGHHGRWPKHEMRASIIVACLLATAGSRAEEPSFFRIQSTQATRIISFDLVGGIAWSNTIVPAPCQIYWTPSLRGLWITNQFISAVATSSPAHAPIPSVFATGTPSHVLQVQVNQRLNFNQDATVDLDADGQIDIRFRRYCIGTPEGPLSYDTIDLDPDTVQAILRPHTNGEFISPNIPPGDSWTATHYPYTLAYRPCGAITGAFSNGAWAGVTNGYVPVRTTASGKSHYGWVQLVLYDELILGTTDIYSTVVEIIDSGMNAKENAGIGAGER